MKPLTDECQGRFAFQPYCLLAGIFCCLVTLHAIGGDPIVRADEIPPQDTPSITNEAQTPAADVSADAAYRYLAREMDRRTDGTVVYDDNDSGAAGFYPINWSGDANALTLMADSRERPFSGNTCARITYQPQGKAGWAGLTWAYPNVSGGNWGDRRGRVLTGATELSGWIRGAAGGEIVRLEAGGINDGPGSNPGKPFKDTLARVHTVPELLALTTDWRPFNLAIPPESNLTGVIGGLSVIFDAKHDRKGATVYLDEVRYNNADRNMLRLVRSYQPATFGEDKSLCNAAFLYDNALALLAFLSRDDIESTARAKILADTLVWLQNHDRSYGDGRWRNAYLAGPVDELSCNMARLPGWWQMPGMDIGMPAPSAAGWVEDRYQVSSDTGNMAWAIIALLAAHRHLDPQDGESAYLRAALRGAEWVELNCRVDETASRPDALTGKGGGYTGGFDGWENGQGGGQTVSPQDLGPKRLLWRSTEHNIDLCVAFMQLADVTGDPVWLERAAHARLFVLNMYDQQEGHFWAGAADLDGAVNRDVVPVDVQAWSLLAMGHDPELRRVIGWQDDTQLPAPLQWLEANARELQPDPACGGSTFGYKFSREGSGIWVEGTAQVAAAYQFLGRKEQVDKIISYLASPVFVSESDFGDNRTAGMYAACPDKAVTGFRKEIGTWTGQWTYPRQLHIGATSWYLFAKLGVNPFWR